MIFTQYNKFFYYVNLEIEIKYITLGGVAEWLNALVLKTSMPAKASQVRILSPPPLLKILR